MIQIETNTLLAVFSLAYSAIEIAGIITAILAIHDTRTPQGAVAWAISLIMLPLFSLPCYWIFGRSKFHGYVESMRVGREEFIRQIGDNHEIPSVRSLPERKRRHAPRTVFETLAQIPFLGGNELELLTDGSTSFKAIFKGIRSAKEYVLVQFYTVNDDELGNELSELLIEKIKEGVRVLFLYDEIGSHDTPDSFWEKLRDAGVGAYAFHSTKGPGNRLQLNFRNHRKIVVVDGHTAFVGGNNVGDEYLGRTSEFEGWRDTHLRISGPAVMGVQISFAKDWYWATNTLAKVNLTMPDEVGAADVLALGTGPADDVESCSLMFIRAIDSAQERLWIASPYFVPDTGVMKALQLAAMRGVDVRIMLPEKPDHRLVHLASLACLKEMALPGIRVFRYQKDFLHQKVFLVDDNLAGVGTANMDNRSFRLNFEITMLVEDAPFCREIEAMFLADFSRCDESDAVEFDHKNILMKTLIKFARLLSPIL